MKAIAPHDRPREKLQRAGVAALGDNELLAAVLGHGDAERSALDLANAVLQGAGGLDRLVRRSHDDLCGVAGIGPARAAQILAAVELGRRSLVPTGRARPQITSPRAAADLLLPQFGSRPVEHFGVVLLDTRRRVLRTTVISIGTLDASLVHPREVFREAATAGAAALVLFHNHPSGDPEPSADDVALTRRLASAGVLMGIEVVDHVVLADARYCSLREKGLV
jgi:DNA repair protein RadC